MPHAFDPRRRRLLGGAASAGLLSLARPSLAAPLPAFGPLRHVRAGLLDVGYVELGPAGGAPVILLHGWPYDIHSFAEAAPLLAAAGRRVIVPWLRGHGTTRFLAPDTVRNGQQAAVACDLLALMDALGIARAVLAGFDWGARSTAWSGRAIRRAGASTTPLSSVPPRPSTIPTMSTS
jgi:pimeloyl-ACP methyl ester carboxylesterase